MEEPTSSCLPADWSRFFVTCRWSEFLLDGCTEHTMCHLGWPLPPTPPRLLAGLTAECAASQESSAAAVAVCLRPHGLSIKTHGLLWGRSAFGTWMYPVGCKEGRGRPTTKQGAPAQITCIGTGLHIALEVFWFCFLCRTQTDFETWEVAMKQTRCSPASSPYGSRLALAEAFWSQKLHRRSICLCMDLYGEMWLVITYETNLTLRFVNSHVLSLLTPSKYLQETPHLTCGKRAAAVWHAVWARQCPLLLTPRSRGCHLPICIARIRVSSDLIWGEDRSSSVWYRMHWHGRIFINKGRFFQLISAALDLNSGSWVSHPLSSRFRFLIPVTAWIFLHWLILRSASSLLKSTVGNVWLSRVMGANSTNPTAVWGGKWQSSECKMVCVPSSPESFCKSKAILLKCLRNNSTRQTLASHCWGSSVVPVAIPRKGLLRGFLNFVRITQEATAAVLS